MFIIIAKCVPCQRHFKITFKNTFIYGKVEIRLKQQCKMYYCEMSLNPNHQDNTELLSLIVY